MIKGYPFIAKLYCLGSCSPQEYASKKRQFIEIAKNCGGEIDQSNSRKFDLRVRFEIEKEVMNYLNNLSKIANIQVTIENSEKMKKFRRRYV